MRSRPSPSFFGDDRWRIWGAGLIPVLLTFVVYLAVLQNGFVWDDEDAILKNLPLRSLGPDSLRWMLTSFLLGNWTPLTWLSLALDYQVGGLHPWVYHLDNLFWHCLNSFLVFRLALKVFRAAHKASPPVSGEWPAALIASVLFGLHPLHVETVAWALERNDLLCAAFTLFSLLSYMDYARDPVREKPKYAVCIAFFAFALLSKPVAVTLPLILLLLDAWPLRRLRGNFFKMFLEKMPFFALSFPAGIMAMAARASVGNIPGFSQEPFFVRVVNAFHSLAFYLGKLVWPIDLAVLYPLTPWSGVLNLPNSLSILAVAVLSTGCWIYRKKFPFFFTSWFFYCLALLPMLGLLQSGNQAAADRYTYLPTLGFFLLAGAALARFLQGKWRVPAALGLLFLMAFWGAVTLRQTGIWKNPVALWENAARISKGDSPVVLDNLGEAYRSGGRLADALQAYDRALALDPRDVDAHNGKAVGFFLLGRPQDSLQEFKTAISIDPGFDQAYYNEWIVCQRLGLYAESLEAARGVAGIHPASARPYDLMGISYGDLGQFNLSFASFEKALELEPGNAAYLQHWTATKRRAQDPKETMQEYQKELEGS